MADPVTLVTLDVARKRCRILIDAEDDDLQLMIEQASSAAIQFCNNPTMTDLWDEDTVPAGVQGAILEQVLWMFERNTDANLKLDERGGLCPRAWSVLIGWRSPACS
jgi:hypothetical protein